MKARGSTIAGSKALNASSEYGAADMSPERSGPAGFGGRKRGRRAALLLASVALVALVASGTHAQGRAAPGQGGAIYPALVDANIATSIQNDERVAPGAIRRHRPPRLCLAARQVAVA